MDTFRLIEEPRLDPSAWAHWAARLSMSVVWNLPAVQDEHARRGLRSTVDEFLRSGLPSDELRRMLKEEMR